jgi:hypothetical protein
MRSIFTSVLTLGLVANVFAQSYEERRQQHILNAIANENIHTNVVRAHEGLPLIQEYLDTIYSVMLTKSTIDFDIVRLVRAMFLSDGVYDDQILSNLNLVPYWVNYGDTLRGYWSENHMIMWMSSDWLIHERTGRPIDATLEQRLKHYLNVKIEYGFYEFLSPTYFPYTLCGLLNLVDFVEDEEIKALAEQAARRLLKEVLLVVNDEGAFYPAAGRSHGGRYVQAHGQNHSSVVYLLTGKGPEPQVASQGSSFLATSSLDMTDIVNSWTTEMDTVLSIGHTLEEGQVINQELTYVDRVMMQWSGGGYFHPLLVEETVGLLIDSNMWDHVDFDLLAPLAGFPADYYPTLSESLTAISKSSVISGQDVHIFKNNGVTLASVHDFHKGKVGFQQWPVVAGVGTAAVYPASGPASLDWSVRNGSNANEHLPYVGQNANVALIMYWPEFVPELLPFNNKDVTLHWPEEAFDEVTESGNWLLGRQGDNYVAVRKACTGQIEGLWGCETPVGSGFHENGQTWVLIVGNEQMYGDFQSFSELVEQATFTEEWEAISHFGVTYYASISFDGNDVEYAWFNDMGGTSVSQITEAHSWFHVYPNPTSGLLHFDLEKDSRFTLTDLTGRQVISGRAPSGRNTLDVSPLNDGMYVLTLEGSGSVRVVKMGH